MRFQVDTAARTLSIESHTSTRTLDLYSPEAFAVLSSAWVKVGWSLEHWKSFSWQGSRIMQLPEDVLRLQEVLHQLQPDLIIETGINEGGSSIFFSTMCALAGKGKVVSIELTLKPGVRESIVDHPHGHRVTVLEGDSCSPEILAEVAALAKDATTVFVFLDSNHTKAHVAKELDLYSPFVSMGSYIVATDGIMRELIDTPQGKPEWLHDNPSEAALEFAAKNPAFVLERPTPQFVTRAYNDELSYYPDAWLRRVAE